MRQIKSVFGSLECLKYQTFVGGADRPKAALGADVIKRNLTKSCSY